MGKFRKALGSALAGVYAWAVAYEVLTPKQLGLAGVVLTVAAVYGITNDPA